MNRKILVGISIAALGVSALAGCSQSGGAPGYGAPAGSTSSTAQPTKAGQSRLAAASSSLGTIVVDETGRTVYVFDKDTPNSGTSACEGACLASWPAVTLAPGVPHVQGISGTLGTITRTDGARQVTLNGLPLYYYAGDTVAGDVTGQGIGGIWWVVSPAGAKITGSRGGY
jgi:predicted lipoprotein with Yx(FWY)xxD motif